MFTIVAANKDLNLVRQGGATTGKAITKNLLKLVNLS